MSAAAGETIDDRRITWLAAYPKSGNTWLRALLGAWFNDGPVNINAWPRPVDASDLTYAHYAAVSPRPLDALHPHAMLALRGAAIQHVLCAHDPILCKTHMVRGRASGVDLIPAWMTRAAVCVVRNPFDVAVSFAHHLDVGFDDAITFMAERGTIMHKHGAPGLIHVLTRWDEHVASWAECDDTLVVRYEDLASNTARELKRILAHCGLDDCDGARVDRAAANASFDALAATERASGFIERRTGTFFRRGEVTWGDELRAAQRRRIEGEFADTLARFYGDKREVRP